MTKQEFESLYGNNVGVHCDSELKANEFLALADRFGYKWCSGGSLLSSNEWKYYGVNTVYVCCLENELAFGAINVALASEMVIVEYQLQPKFKVGDKVRVNGTSNHTIDGKIGVIEKIDVLSGLPYSVKLDHDEKWFWLLTENNLEKVEEPTYKEETIDDIGEIKQTLKELKLLLEKMEITIEEKEIPLTIFGYDLKDVIRTTELLRENFISPDDLRNEMEAYERGFNQGVKIGENIYE